jgi:hypothetical protein
MAKMALDLTQALDELALLTKDGPTTTDDIEYVMSPLLRKVDESVRER